MDRVRVGNWDTLTLALSLRERERIECCREGFLPLPEGEGRGEGLLNVKTQAIRAETLGCATVTFTGIDFDVGVPVPSPKRESGTSGLVSG